MHYHHHPFFAMGTPCELQLYGADAQACQKIAESVVADVARLEAKYSRYRDDSLLSEINRVAAEGGEITLDEETQGIFNYADTCHEQSGGLFDISSGILREAWDFKSGIVPDAASVEALLPRIGWEKLSWQPPLLKFPFSGMELDLGGIVKEYAADRVSTLCKEQGVDHGMINLGGDIRAIGAHPDGKSWQIGIRDPSFPEKAMLNLELNEGALASSGDYARCITVEGKRYGHVLNPKTGWPVSKLAAVSVVADLCVVAGSASTIAMLKGEDGVPWLEELGLPYLYIDVEGKAGGTLLE